MKSIERETNYGVSVTVRVSEDTFFAMEDMVKSGSHTNKSELVRVAVEEYLVSKKYMVFA